jgi:hypothetical protein
MALSTAGDLITLALRNAGVNGVGQSPSFEDANDGLMILSAMVAGWQRKRWLVWSLADTSLVSTGAASYTVGPAGDFAIARPDKLEAAYARLLTSGPNYLDAGLGIIEAREDWSQISLKTLTTFPSAVFYDSAWPTGVLHVWPVPAASIYEIHIVTKATLPVFGALTDPLNLPPEYIEALLYSLAVRLAMNYGLQPQPAHVQAMRAALNTIRMANTEIATLGMPAGVSGRAGSGRAASADPAFQSGRW